MFLRACTKIMNASHENYKFGPLELSDNEKNFTIMFLHNKWEQLNQS